MSADVASNGRHLPTRQGARWHRQMWRQNVASLAHAASGGQVALPGVESKRGLPTRRQGARWRRQMWRHLPTWRQAARWHRRSCTRVHANGLTWRHRTRRDNVASLAHLVSESHMASLDVASKCGVRCHRPTRRRRTWRQYVASGGPGLPARKRVFSHRAICAPQLAPVYVHIYIYIYIVYVSGSLRCEVPT